MRMLSWLRHLKRGSNGTDPHVTGLLGGGHANVIVVLPMLYKTCGGEVCVCVWHREKVGPCGLKGVMARVSDRGGATARHQQLEGE